MRSLKECCFFFFIFSYKSGEFLLFFDCANARTRCALFYLDKNSKRSRSRSRDLFQTSKSDSKGKNLKRRCSEEEKRETGCCVGLVVEIILPAALRDDRAAPDREASTQRWTASTLPSGKQRIRFLTRLLGSSVMLGLSLLL